MLYKFFPKLPMSETWLRYQKRLPLDTSLKHQRLYVLYLTVAMLIVTAQLLYLFLYCAYAPFWCICLYSILVIVGLRGFLAIVRGDINRSHGWMIPSATACVVLGWYIYGATWGLEYYVFGLISGTLVSTLALRWRVILILTQAIAGIGLMIYAIEAPPIVYLPEHLASQLRLFNWVAMSLFIVLVAMATTYFVDSVGADADLDGLTGAYNRRALIRLAYWLNRTQTGYGLLVFDLDHFKRINDTHGHALGDKVLMYFVSVLRKLSRQQDFVTRIGGEEFVMILPGLTHQQACQVAERIRQEIAQTPFQHNDITLLITTSIGVALSNEADTIEGVMARADQRLYQAKASGRDRVISDDEATASWSI